MRLRLFNLKVLFSFLKFDQVVNLRRFPHRTTPIWTTFIAKFLQRAFSEDAKYDYDVTRSAVWCHLRLTMTQSSVAKRLALPHRFSSTDRVARVPGHTYFYILNQRLKLVSESWVMGQMGHHFWMGYVGHGSLPLTHWPMLRISKYEHQATYLRFPLRLATILHTLFLVDIENCSLTTLAMIL